MFEKEERELKQLSRHRKIPGYLIQNARELDTGSKSVKEVKMPATHSYDDQLALYL